MNNLVKFEHRIESICANAFERADNLRDGLQACEGLFPTVAVSHFKAIDRKRTKRWLEQAATEVQPRTLGTSDLADSFFLSTWDFCAENVGTIAAYTVNSKRRTCLLGVPSLVPFLSATSESRPHVLFDLRVPITESIKSVTCLPKDIITLSGHELSEAFDLCVLDPPWYVSNYIKWIDIAGSYCKDGGIIAFALLGRLTRPRADSDREEILEYCRTRGLSVKIHKKLVLYDTPSFERHMLWRAGIPPVPWKRADLVIATRDSWKPSSCSFPQPSPLPLFGQARAFGILVDIVFDRYEAAVEELLLQPSDGYWMETPSRRVPSISHCNVFTSNGAKFISPRPIDLFTALRAVKNCDESVQWTEIERLGFPIDVFGNVAKVRKRAV